MTPPNELEQLAEFKDAIQSNKGLERLRAMQYLQQMNNQGLMEMPQVTQQPVIQRENGGRISFENLDEVDAAKAAGQLNAGDKFLVKNMLGEFIIGPDGNIGQVELDASTRNMLREGTMQDDAYIRSQFDEEGNLIPGAFNNLMENRADGGPVVNRFFGGGVVDVIKQLKDSDTFKSTENTGTPQVISTSVPFMGGSGTYTPDPNVSQAEALENLKNMGGGFFGGALGNVAAQAFEQGLLQPTAGAASEVNYQEDPMSSPQAMNDEIVNTQGEGITFNFGAANFISNAGGPIPLRENTAQGVFDRSTKGGGIDTGNFPRYQYGPGSKITDTWGSNEPPNNTGWDINIPHDPNATGPFIRKKPEETNPTSGLLVMKLNPETGNYESSPNNFGVTRAGGGQAAPDQMAQGLAGLGRYGDNMLLHINPEELQGLASMGKITYNPITGLPEAWGFKSFFKPFKQAFKSIKKVAKSKAFRTIAPLALTIAAPYLAASFFPATFGVAGVTGGLAAQVAAMGPIAFGASTAIGSGLGALAAGAKPKDALKAAALSGVTAGGMRGFTNYMDPNIDSVWGKTYGGGGTKAKTFGGFGVKTGSPSSFKAGYAQGPGQQVYQNPAGPGNQLGAQRYEDLQLSQPDITSGGAPGTTTVESRPFDYGATADMGPYQGSFTPTPEPVNLPPDQLNMVSDATLTPGYSQTTGPQPNMLQRAGQQIVDSPVGQAVSDAGQYVADIPMGDYTVGDIGGAMYDDYGTGIGLAKLAAIDATIPDYREQYALEDERKRQLEELEKLGYSIELSDAETGFNQTMVIRDPSGKVLPSTLSIQDLLDRAYGRTPRTRLVDRTDYAPTTAKHGGLINLAHGGDFSGKVTGNGHGMQDNVYMPIKEDGEQVGTLAVSPSEYVVDAYTMSALGNGNADAGAKVMDGVVESVRKKAYGTMRQPNEINGLQALKPMMMGV